MTDAAVLDRAEERHARPAALITNLARRSFAALSREQAQAVLQVRPDPVAAVRRPGPDPYHVLLFGAGVRRGVGLRTHNLGLPGRIADELVARRGRGVHIDVVVEPQATAPKVMAGLAAFACAATTRSWWCSVSRTWRTWRLRSGVGHWSAW